MPDDRDKDLDREGLHAALLDLLRSANIKSASVEGMAKRP